MNHHYICFIEKQENIHFIWLGKSSLSYCIYPKYLDTLSTYHTCPKIWNSPLYYLLMCLKYCCVYGKHTLRHLIWVYTVCKGLSVPILRVIMVWNMHYLIFQVIEPLLHNTKLCEKIAEISTVVLGKSWIFLICMLCHIYLHNIFIHCVPDRSVRPHSVEPELRFNMTIMGWQVRKTSNKKKRVFRWGLLCIPLLPQFIDIHAQVWKGYGIPNINSKYGNWSKSRSWT